MRVELSEIDVLGDDQYRELCRTAPTWSKEWLIAQKNVDAMPPIKITRVGRKFHIIDGKKRFYVTQKLGRKDILAEVVC